MFEFNCGIDGLDTSSNSVVEKATVESILSSIKSGISFDIAKNHTGVCIWDGSKVEILGFDISYDYDSTDYLAEAKMRLWLKNKCEEIMKGRHFDICQVEGVFGGVNYDTSRKLIALNGVVAELILEGRVSVSNYYNLTQKEWSKDFRTVIKLGKALSSKYETQEILKYLGFNFVLENENLSNAEKEAIFYEDKCDAVGMLCGVALRLNSNANFKKSSSVALSNVKMYFIEDMYDTYSLNDKVFDDNQIISVDITSKDLEKEIRDLATKHDDCILATCLENKQLGVFGINNGFTFFEQGYGYLVFYNKELKRK